MATTVKQAEGWVRLALAVVIVGLVIWLIVVDPTLSSQGQILLRILLSFALAVLTASMAGLIEVQGKQLGWGIRAAGGFAVFLVTYFFTPAAFTSLNPRLQAALDIAPIRQIDLRSIDGAGTPAGESGEAGVAITVPLSATAHSKIAPVDPALIKSATLNLKINSRNVDASWAYFVEMIQGKSGTWLSSNDGPTLAVGYPVPLNVVSAREVMFLTDKAMLNWSQVIDALRSADGQVEILVTIDTEQELKPKSVTTKCSIARGSFAPPVNSYIEKNKRSPLRATIPCLT